MVVVCNSFPLILIMFGDPNAEGKTMEKLSRRDILLFILIMDLGVLLGKSEKR